uniref:Mediator of RNA polymerase II transcription subunit 12 n=1 Tax=Steinernema glaseri TaxID=37863 RepID=A0A1I8A0Q1_9BILA
MYFIKPRFHVVFETPFTQDLVSQKYRTVPRKERAFLRHITQDASKIERDKKSTIRLIRHQEFYTCLCQTASENASTFALPLFVTPALFRLQHIQEAFIVADLADYSEQTATEHSHHCPFVINPMQLIEFEQVRSSHTKSLSTERNSGRMAGMPLLCNSDDNLLEVVTQYLGRAMGPDDLRKAVAAFELHCQDVEDAKMKDSQDVELGDKLDELMTGEDRQDVKQGDKLDEPKTGEESHDVELGEKLDEPVTGEKSQDVGLGDKHDEPMTVPSVGPTSTVETPSSITDEAEWNPPPGIVKEVDVIIKELAYANVTHQVTQIARIVREQPEDFIVWLVRVLMHKIPDMTNTLSTYYEFFQALCRDEPGWGMERLMREQIYSHVKELLSRQSCLVSGFDDRKALKNFGSWLGFMTIAKERPILDRELNIKELLETALANGNTALCGVVPFVTRVMQSCRLSLASFSIFSPASAWTRSIIRILTAIHQSDEVKMNIKFDVAVLLRALGVNIEDVETEECLDPARATQRRMDFTGFPERFDGDPMESKFQLVQDLNIPIVVVEQTLLYHQFYVDIPDAIVGIDEDTIRFAHGQMPEVIKLEAVDEIVRHRCIRPQFVNESVANTQAAINTQTGGGFVAVPATNEVPRCTMHSDDNSTTVALPEEQSVDYTNCAKALFIELSAKYNAAACAQIEANAAISQSISAYKEQGVLGTKSAEPFLVACMKVYFPLCYTIDDQGHLSRHHCLFHADSLARIVSMTAEELVRVCQEASGKFIGVMLSTIQEILLDDYESKGHEKFLTFPYSRIILSVMWNLMDMCLRLKKPDLLLVYQRDMATLMMRIQPANIPCFAFCWLDIIGNYKIIWGFTHNPPQSSRTIYSHFLVTMLEFLSKITSSPGNETPESVEKLKEGMERLICYLQLQCPTLLSELRGLMQ